MVRWAGSGVVIVFAALLVGCGDDGGAGAETGSGSSGSSESGSTTGEGSTGVSSGSSSGSADGTTTGAGDTGSSGTATGMSSTGTSGSGSGSESGSTGGGEALGELMGRCGVLGDMRLTGDMPGFFVNTLDFGDVGWDYDVLTPGGQEIFDDGNLGGSSLYSEVVAYEVLARCEGAMLLKTETEILYDAMGTRTDLLVDFDGTKIGVSVTRAQGFPLEDPYTVMQAETLLTDKLGDVLASSALVSAEDAWEKQILHVVAYAPMHAESLVAAYAGLPPEITSDTIVVVTVTDGEDLFIYTE